MGCEPGTPDLLCCKGPLSFRIEVKRDAKGTLTRSQVKWIAAHPDIFVRVCWSPEMALAAMCEFESFARKKVS